MNFNYRSPNGHNIMQSYKKNCELATSDKQAR